MGEHGECSHKGRTNVLSRIKRRSTWRSPTTDAFRNSDAGNSARFRMPLDHATPQATDDSSLALLRDSSLSTRGIDTRLLESHNGANIVYIRAPICGSYSFDARKGRETVSGRVPFSNATGSRHAAGDSARPRERTERRS